jgi:hypothetical protein
VEQQANFTFNILAAFPFFSKANVSVSQQVVSAAIKENSALKSKKYYSVTISYH